MFLKTNHIYQGDALEVLKTFPDECVDTIITSPPYWSLRDYKTKGQLGLENTLEEYLDKLLSITAELKRVLKPKGVMFWVHGNSYAGNMGKHSGWSEYTRLYNIDNSEAQNKGLIFDPDLKLSFSLPQKCLTNQNLRLLLRMTDEQGWINRNMLIWDKPNALPSPVQDRFTCSYETIFMLTKKKKYYFDLDSVRVPYSKTGLERKKRVHAKYGSNIESGGAKLSKGINKGSQPIFIEPHPRGKNPGDVWTISPANFPGAHFAVFPPKLIEPMIKATCPEKVCKKCGKPREKLFTKEKKPSQKEREELRGEYSKHQQTLKKPPNKNWLSQEKFIGLSDCGCNSGWEKGIVLDPFLGSGTTALVALKHNRTFIGIELNPDYIKIAEKRIASWINQTRLEDFQEVVS